MKTVIYTLPNYSIVKVTSEDVNITDLKDNEDFMPVDVWNESDDKVRFPTIE